jgi:Icc-related predicted phosphoesterase
VHHAPPAQSPTSWGGNRYFGDVELREWIERYQPNIVLSGHVHQSPFVKEGSWVDRIGETWVFNAGQHAGAPCACDHRYRGGRGALVLGGRQSSGPPP